MSPEPGFATTQLAVVSDARTQQVREQARVGGYAAGWAEGTRAAAVAAQRAAERVAERVEEERAVARAQVDAALATLASAARAVNDRTIPVVEKSHELIVRLALDLAEAIVGVELSSSERSARSALARALAVPAGTEIVAIRLNPHDLARLDLLAGAAAKAGHVVGVPDGVELVADATLAPGDAISHLPTGYLDARVATGAARLRAAVEQALDSGEPLVEQAVAAGDPEARA